MAKRKEELGVVISAQDAFSRVLKTVVSAAAAIGLYKLGTQMIEQAIGQTDAEIKLAQALGKTSDALVTQASALQQVTKFGDDQVMQAQAMLAMFIKDENQIKQLTKATLDFAAAKGMDLVAAADLVAKSVGSSTNALTRYGIVIDGAVGSTQRATSAVDGLAKAFGGQAQAQANNFSGKMTQLKNNFGDVLEEIGLVITRNPVVVKAIGLLSQKFMELAQWINRNRQAYIDMSNAIAVYVMRQMRNLVEGVRAVHVGWLMMRAAVQYAISWIYEALSKMVTWMRETVLAPFDLLAKKLVDLGYIKVNPFDSITLGLDKLQLKHLETTISILNDVTLTNEKYTELSNRLDTTAMKIEALKGKQIQVKDMMVQGANEVAETLNYTAITFEEMYRKMIGWSEKATTVTVANEQIMAKAGQWRANVSNAAYKAMETQLQRYIELHKFSVGEFTKAVIQTVKMELIGIAARATVWALFELAMGLASAATGNMASASLHFAAAGQFAAIAGVTLALAAALNAYTGPKEPTQPGTEPSNPIYTSEAGERMGSEQGVSSVTNVNITIMNPLGNEDYDEIVEQKLLPALNRVSGERGVTLNVTTA